MSLAEVRGHVARWTTAGEPWVEATLVRVERSAPRLPGARFTISAGGDAAGSISAGCVESDLHEHMLQALADRVPRLVRYGISDERAADVGLSCGGEIEVLICPRIGSDPIWTELEAILDDEKAGLLLTGISGRLIGRRMLVRSDGSIVGGFGRPGIDRELADSWSCLLGREGTRIVATDEHAEVFVESVMPRRRLVIVGAGPAGSALARMAALVDYRVTVVDPREALLGAHDFGDARLLRGWPDETLSGGGIDPWTDVAVLAHDSRLDVPALAAALRAGCRYIGLLGGRRTQRLRREALLELGFEPGDVERIRGPIGLRIDARTPSEIALAVLAEMIACRRGVHGTWE